MIKNDFFSNNFYIKEINFKNEEIDYNNLSQLEKDIFILINYIRTNPLNFSIDLKNKNKYTQNKEQIEIIKYFEEFYNTERLDPFEEIPEISKAAGNLLFNIKLNDKKCHNINLKELNPSILNLRTRLSNYGHRTGRIFETVVFKTNNPEDIINHILRDENGRNMLLSNKMKFIGIACDILPSNIICSVIDIVQDFIPYKNNENLYEDINYNNNYNIKIKYKENKNYEENSPLIDKQNIDNNINNLKFKLDDRESKIEYYNLNKDIIINNNIKNEQKISNLLKNKNTNQRKNNNFHPNNELYKTPIKINSMEIPLEECFSPKSINSYNIIINNKIMPIKKNTNSISPIKKEENNNNDNVKNNIFTMAGRTSKEQQEIIEFSSKVNLNKSRSFSSFDFKINNSRINNKSKFQRLNQKEKLEILHKINQRNKNQKSLSTNNKNFDSLNSINRSNIRNKNIFQKKDYNLEINIEDRNKINNNYYFDTQNNIIDNSPDNKYNRFNTFLSKINDSNIVNYCNANGSSQIYPFYNESKNYENNNEYSQIKNDLLLFKNKIKQELKNEVKNELKEEIKLEFNINQKKRKPNSMILEDLNLDNITNNKRKIINDFQSQKENNENKLNIMDDNIYLKKNNSNYFIKNKIKNRSCSEEKIIVSNNNKSKWIINKKERKTFEPKNHKSNDSDYLKNKYKERYEQLNDSPINEINHSVYQNFYNKNNVSSDLLNKIKDRQQIKKLIRLYNIAKDNKRNNEKNNENNFYDIINNNRSISNYLFVQNKNNEEENINNNLSYLNNQNKGIKEKIETKNKEIKKEKNLTNKFIFQKKYEKVKPIGNFHKFKNYTNGNNIQNLNEENNEINEINKKAYNQFYEINEKNKENVKVNSKNIDNLKDEKLNNNSIKKLLTSSTGNIKENIININNLKEKNSIKSNNIKNIIYNKTENDKNGRILFSNSQKTDKQEIIDEIKNKAKNFNINNEQNDSNNNIIKNKQQMNNNNERYKDINYENQNENKNIKDDICNDSKNNSMLKTNDYFLEDKNIEILKTPNYIQKDYKNEINNKKKYNSHEIFNKINSKTTPIRQKKYISNQYFPFKSKNNTNNE